MEQHNDIPSTIDPAEAAAAASAGERMMKLRTYRNSLADMLPLSLTTYPLQDIPVYVRRNDAVVQYNEPGTVNLAYSQPGVLYNIYDQTKTMVTGDGKGVIGTGGPLTIKTTPLTLEDYVYSVAAERPGDRIGTRLLQTVSVKTGVKKDLDVQLKTSPVVYGSKAVVIVKSAQGNTKYQLFGPDNKPLSVQTDSGPGGDLEVITTDGMQEDVRIHLRSTNNKTGQTDQLDNQIDVVVETNLALQPVLAEAAVSYGGTAVIKLGNTQRTASYQIHFVRFEEWGDGEANKEQPKNTVIGASVPGNGGEIELPVGSLTKDLTVSIKVTKINSALQPQSLLSDVFIPVLPDTGKELTIANRTRNAATIKVSNTQPGVMYQLRLDANNSLIGRPVYHHKNQGIGKAHLESDFVVDDFTGNAVLLPTGTLRQTATFNVLARKPAAGPDKTVQWLEVELEHTITVEINVPPLRTP